VVLPCPLPKLLLAGPEPSRKERIMRVKLRTARAYALAAHAAILAVIAGTAVVSVTKLRARAGVLIASLAILAGIAIPGIANASAAIPNAIHRGTWRITTPLNFTQSNAPSITRSTVSACWDISDAQGTFGWHVAVIWFHGGRNTVLWHSREFSDNDAGPHCSPRIRIRHPHHPKVFSQETVNCNLIIAPCLVRGDWSLRTN
jgi:hypothetical protein